MIGVGHGFWVSPCSIHPQVASPTKRGAELPAHTSGKPHSICCGMSNKDEETTSKEESKAAVEPGDTAGYRGVKTGARGLIMGDQYIYMTIMMTSRSQITTS